MSLNSRAIHDVIHPTAAFVVDSTYESVKLVAGNEFRSRQNEKEWESSPLNPRNRIDSLDFPSNPLWRIDGCTGLGTQFYAIPLFIAPAIPSRIDVFIPEQSTQPPEIRSLLQLDDAFHAKDKGRVMNLGITRLIVRKLQQWTRAFADPPAWYRSLPFGSRIVFDNISLVLDQIRIRVAPMHNLERQLKSADFLSKLWKNNVTLPPQVPLSNLELIEQLHDSVCVVRFDSRLWILKALTSYPKYIYHELRNLLAIESHKNVISRPAYLATKRCSFGNKNAVVGFLLEYHEQGTLRDILPLRRAHDILTLSDQLRWSLQITEAILHLHENCHVFYPDLRLDNVVLSQSDDAIIVDLEQRGVWCEFSAPEVNFIQYMLLLATSEDIPESVQSHYNTRIRRLLRGFDDLADFTSTEEHVQLLPSYNVPWLCLSRGEQEAAEVYMLGRVIWCIFEGVSAPHQTAFWQSYKWESDLEFPNFRRTPEKIRSLINRCTSGRRHTLGEKVSRVGSRLEIVAGLQSAIDKVPATPESSLHVIARKWWKEEIRYAEEFLDHRESLLEKGQWPDNYFNRPSLKMLWNELDEYRQKVGIPEFC
ncbi:hypothetical protein jhhlp_007305 [Lomentospora prolificans]|uniref:EKC/KEOPS complex subunit BUD32 n=1 Tax=Lomentospora prolificans TaxID=41688 RepID=A0A2N3N2A8_9PEZI|nr:hypothetical protein jhhlp_007305 [Lomentospora prolificans]